MKDCERRTLKDRLRKKDCERRLVKKDLPDVIVRFLQELLCLCHPLVQLVHLRDLCQKIVAKVFWYSLVTLASCIIPTARSNAGKVNSSIRFVRSFCRALKLSM